MFGWFKKAAQSSVSAQAEMLPIDRHLFHQEGPGLYEALGDHWAASDPKIYRRLAAQDDVAALEERYSLNLPDDFRDYLLHAAPGTTFMDGIGTQWWAPGDIKSIADECPDGSPGQINLEIEREKDTYLVFADFLIWCYAWAICCSDGPNRGRIALIGGQPDGFVADNFRDFLLLALTDNAAIHQPSRKKAGVPS